MLGSRGCPHGGLLYPRPHMTGLVPSRPCLLPWPGISAPPVPLRCQYSSCLAERCQGAVPVRPPVPPPEPAGEGLLWHPLRGPRQAEGERLCGVTEAPCRARRGMAAVWCCIVCSVWRWAALCSSCPHCVHTLVCAVPPALLPPAGLGTGLPLHGLLVPAVSHRCSWRQTFVTELLQSLPLSFQHWLEFTKSVVKQMRGKHRSWHKQNTEQCPAGQCVAQLGAPHPCSAWGHKGCCPTCVDQGRGGGGGCVPWFSGRLVTAPLFPQPSRPSPCASVSSSTPRTPRR